jgi:hypothetical protein
LGTSPKSWKNILDCPDKVWKKKIAKFTVINNLMASVNNFGLKDKSPEGD